MHQLQLVSPSASRTIIIIIIIIIISSSSSSQWLCVWKQNVTFCVITLLFFTFKMFASWINNNETLSMSLWYIQKTLSNN